jgi:thiol-disulfide isomerase/thioredoxin
MEQHQSYIVIENTQHFKQIIRNEDTENVLYVIDFHATWCGPCKKIAPDYTKLAEKYGKHMLFMKCDVDEAQELSDVFSIESLPTFVFGYNKNIIDKFEGANLKKVESKINEYIGMEDRQYSLLSDNGEQDDEQSDDGEQNDGEQDDGEQNDGEQDDGEQDDEQSDDGEQDDEQSDDGEQDDEQSNDGEQDDEQSNDGEQDDEQNDGEHDETSEEPSAIESSSDKELHQKNKELQQKNKELQQKCRSLEKDNKRIEKVLAKIKSMAD